MIPIIWNSRKDKTMQSVKRSVVARSGDQQGAGREGAGGERRNTEDL